MDDRPPPLRWPTMGALLRQLGSIVLLIALWSLALALFLQATEPAPAADAPVTVEAPAASDTPTPAEQRISTDTPAPAELAPTNTPAPAEQLPATDTPTPADEPSAQISFANDVLPIFASRCQRCHGPERVEGGLRLTGYQQLMAGGDEGAVIVPGDPVASRLYRLIASGEMPRRSPALPPAEIDLIGAWITADAPDN